MVCLLLPLWSPHFSAYFVTGFVALPSHGLIPSLQNPITALGFPYQLQPGPRVDPVLGSNADIPGFTL